MHLHFTSIIFLLSCGVIAGFIDAIAGGGGLIMLPAFLTAGIPPHLTLGTNKLSATMGVCVSAYTYIKRGLFDPRLWPAAIIAVFVGAGLGALATHLFSSDFFKLFLPFFVIFVGIFMLMPKKMPSVHNGKNYKPNKLSSVGLGSLLGFYDGFIGPGTGSFWTTAVMAIYKLDIVTASGVARFMNFISNIFALITFMLLNSVDYVIGLSIGIAMIFGSYLGVHTAIKYGGNFIRKVFIAVIIILAVRLIITEWSPAIL